MEIWLYDKTDTIIEGVVMGFDEYMNMVLDDCKEVCQKKNRTVYLGRILLKGDTITLIKERESD